MKGNSGSMTYCLKSRMIWFPLEVYYSEKSIGNIIYFFDLLRVLGMVITLDSCVKFGFNVTYFGKIYHFIPFENGLYYYDTRLEPRSVINKPVFPLSLYYSLLRITKLFICSVKLKERRTPIHNKKQ